MAEKSKTVKVYAPNQGYAGIMGDIRFEKGVAEVPEDHKTLDYFRNAGYGIGEKPAVANPVLPYDKMEPTDAKGNVVDARDFTEHQVVGTPLRDAAVDPREGDYLVPTNAGKANPHGPKVVAPEIHASGPAGIRAGEVYVDDTAKQEKAETELAEKALIEGEPATERQAEFHAGELKGKDMHQVEGGNMGPLGLSDPGSVDMGVEAAKEVRAAESEASSMPGGEVNSPRIGTLSNSGGAAAPARTTRSTSRSSTRTRASGPKSK